MPTNRRPISRPHRPSFSPEALALFAELERVPARARHSQDFKDKSHELARRLHLVDEFWGGNDVTDRSTEPCWPPWCVSHGDWHRCRAIRRALLQTVKESPELLAELDAKAPA